MLLLKQIMVLKKKRVDVFTAGSLLWEGGQLHHGLGFARTHDEDVRLRKLKWKAKYALMRMMYHDMTGIGAYRFGASDVQNLTYSEYYGGNVLKGGIFTQCGGWLGTHEL
jgi:hypothetical protein